MLVLQCFLNSFFTHTNHGTRYGILKYFKFIFHYIHTNFSTLCKLKSFPISRVLSVIKVCEFSSQWRTPEKPFSSVQRSLCSTPGVGSAEGSMKARSPGSRPAEHKMSHRARRDNTCLWRCVSTSLQTHYCDCGPRSNTHKTKHVTTPCWANTLFKH